MSKTRDSAAWTDVFNEHMLTTITNWQENTSANIVTLRRGSGMSQQQLADLLDTSMQVVVEYESAEKSLSTAHLTKLCNFYGVSLLDFLLRKFTPQEAIPRHLGICLWNLVCPSPDGTPEQTEALEKYCHHTLHVSMMDVKEKAPILSIAVGEMIAPGYAICAVQLKDAPKSVRGLLGAADHGLMHLTFASGERENKHCMLMWQASYIPKGIATRAVLLDCVAFSPLEPHMTKLWIKPAIRP